MMNRLALVMIFAAAIAGAAIGGAALSRSSVAAPFMPRAAPPAQVPAQAAQIQTPRFPLTYQGVLLDNNGVPVTATKLTLHFGIYDEVDANASIWSESQRVDLDDGLFTAILGIEERMPPDMFSGNSHLWMGVRVANNPELKPRTRLTFTPFAMHAVTAREVIAPPQDTAKVAMLHWHEANNTNIAVDLDQSPKALGFDGNHLWVGVNSAASTKTDEVYKIDPYTERVVFDMEIGLDPSAVAYDGRKIWITGKADNSITRFLPDGRERETLPQKEFRGKKLVHDDSVLDQPVALAFDGTYMWVVNEGNNSVMRLRAHHQFSRKVPLDRIDDLQDSLDDDDDLDEDDPDKLSQSERNEILEEIEYNRALISGVLDRISVGTSPSAIAFDGAVMWVLHGGAHNVTRIRASDGEVLGSLRVGRGRDDILFDGTYIWVSDSNTNTVSRVRADTLEEAGKFIVGNDPKALTFDGRSVWVANAQSENVTKLRASDGKKLGNYSIGDAPVDLAFDGVNVWAANYNDKSLVKK